jgi:hypothetical protein
MGEIHDGSNVPVLALPCSCPLQEAPLNIISDQTHTKASTQPHFTACVRCTVPRFPKLPLNLAIHVPPLVFGLVASSRLVGLRLDFGLRGQIHQPVLSQ